MNLTEVGDSKIYLCKESIDIETLELIKKMNTSPALNNIRVMPDCHSSTYCCVGMTSLIEDKVIPQIVGGDIGCGVGGGGGGGGVGGGGGGICGDSDSGSGGVGAVTEALA